VSRRWWRDVLSGAATLLDVAGVRSQGRLPPPMVPVTWAVTVEDPGPGWADQEEAGVSPVPALVTWTQAQWNAELEVGAEWAGGEVARPARVWVRTGTHPVPGNALRVHGRVHAAWADAIDSCARTRSYRLY
jgi:hypothetical protein